MMATTFRWVRLVLVGALVVIAVGVLLLVAYSYFFLTESAPLRVRGETAVNTSSLILTTSQGRFLDKNIPLSPNEPPTPALGYPAPDFELPDLNGNPVRLSQFRGRPVLLNFWATWCPPCRKEMPDLQAFSQKYSGRIQVLGVNMDFAAQLEVTNADVLEFLDEYNVTYLNVRDPVGESVSRYRLTGYPVSYWIDEAGLIRGVWLGAMKQEDIVAGFQKISDVIDDE